MERGHQDGIRNNRRSSNIKAYNKKAMLHAIWDRLGACPLVLDAGEEYEQNRRKRKAGDNRTVQAAEDTITLLEIKKVRRETVKIERRFEE